MLPLPEQLKRELADLYGLSEEDAIVLTEEKETTDYFFAVAEKTNNYKAIANWIMGPVRNYLNEHSVAINEFPVTPESIAALIQMIDENKISFTAASQRIFPELIRERNSSVEHIAKELGALQESGEEIIRQLVRSALQKYPEKIQEYRKGKKGVLGLFMGEVMKLSKSTADPKVAKGLLLEQLESK